MANKWITFFSQTGAEIADLSENIGRWPDLIITNQRPDHLRTIDHRIVEYGYTEVPNKPTVEDYETVLQDNSIITLHGWLRIMPPVICNKYLIYNGHPELITKYPELKGKDPQVRAFEGKYPVAGAVIHKVTAGVDEGEVLGEASVRVEGLDLDKTFTILSKLSHGLWGAFLEKQRGS